MRIDAKLITAEIPFCVLRPFAMVFCLTGECWQRISTICGRYVDLALRDADFSKVARLAIDETTRARGHDHLTLAADPKRCAVLSVTEGREAEAVRRCMACDLTAHGADLGAIDLVSIGMLPAYINGCREYLPNARSTFDKFHVTAHTSNAVDETHCAEQKTTLWLKGLRWKLLRDYGGWPHRGR